MAQLECVPGSTRKRQSRTHAHSTTPLPNELAAKIADCLDPFINPPLEPTQLLQSHQWRDALLSGRTLPWLWDLDATAVATKEASLKDTVAVDRNEGAGGTTVRAQTLRKVDASKSAEHDLSALSISQSGDAIPFSKGDDEFASSAPTSQPPATPSWDYERLVRQLAQTEIHEWDGVISGIPVGLRNRRRIWRLIEDIFVEAAEDY